MDEFDEMFRICNDEKSNEIEIELDDVKDVQDSIFKTLTTNQIEKTMNQYIDDVINDSKSIVSVSFNWIFSIFRVVACKKYIALMHNCDQNQFQFTCISIFYFISFHR